MLYLLTEDANIDVLTRYLSRSLAEVYAPLGLISLNREVIALTDIRWGPKFLAAERLGHSMAMVRHLVRAGKVDFPFGFYVAPSGECHVLAPPIVEAYHSEDNILRYLILDGSHRCYAALTIAQSVSALVVSFKEEKVPLPCQPLLPSDVGIVETQPKLSALFVDMSESAFRPVRGLMHKSYVFPSLDRALLIFGLRKKLLIPFNLSVP